MNDRPTPGLGDAPDPADDRLRSQLRALRAPAPAVDALGARVLAQWSDRAGRTHAAAQHLGDARGGAAALGLGASPRHRWAVVTAGLIACAIAAAIAWLPRPDPVLDELMQADVLSQMAIGEM